MSFNSISKNNPANCRGCGKEFKQRESFKKHIVTAEFGYPKTAPIYEEYKRSPAEEQAIIDFHEKGLMPQDCPKALHQQMLPPPQPTTASSSLKRKKDEADSAQASSSQQIGGTDSPPHKLSYVDPQIQEKERHAQHIRGLHAMVHHVYSNQGQTAAFFSKVPADDIQRGPRIHYGETPQEIDAYLMHRQGIADPQQRARLIGQTFQEPANGRYDVNSGKLLDTRHIGSITTSSTIAVDGVDTPVPVKKMPWVGINHSDYNSLFKSPENPRTNIYGVVNAYGNRLNQYRAKYGEELKDERFDGITRHVVPDDEQKLFGLQAFHNIDQLKANPYFCIATHPTTFTTKGHNRLFFETPQGAQDHALKLGIRPEVAADYVANVDQMPADGKYSLATKELLSGQEALYVYKGDEEHGLNLSTGQWLTEMGNQNPNAFTNPALQISSMKFDIMQSKRQAELTQRAETGTVYIPQDEVGRYQQMDTLATKRENDGVEGFIRSGGGPVRHRSGFPMMPGDAPTPSDTASLPQTPSAFHDEDVASGKKPWADTVTRQFDAITDAPSPAFGTPAHYAETPVNYATPRALSTRTNTPPNADTGKTFS